MVLRLIIFLLLYALGPAALGFAVRRGVRALREYDPGWYRRLRGARNARALQAHTREQCVLCLKPVDPDRGDAWHPGLGWYHQTCYENI